MIAPISESWDTGFVIHSIAEFTQIFHRFRKPSGETTAGLYSCVPLWQSDGREEVQLCQKTENMVVGRLNDRLCNHRSDSKIRECDHPIYAHFQAGPSRAPKPTELAPAQQENPLTEEQSKTLIRLSFLTSDVGDFPHLIPALIFARTPDKRFCRAPLNFFSG